MHSLKISCAFRLCFGQLLNASAPSPFCAFVHPVLYNKLEACPRRHCCSDRRTERTPGPRLRATPANRQSPANMKCFKNCVLLTLICVIMVNAEFNVVEELKAMAEQIEIMKTNHVTDVSRLVLEIQELK